jgi:hypothetical protein
MLLTLNEVARRLGLDADAARKIVRKLPAVNINRQRLYPVEDVMEFAKSAKLHALKGGAPLHESRTKNL